MSLTDTQTEEVTYTEISKYYDCYNNMKVGVFYAISNHGK